MKKHVFVLPLLLLMTMSLGCLETKPVEFHDDLDLNFCILCGTGEALNSPYVVGTDIHFTVFREDEDLNLSQTVLVATDENILFLGETSGSEETRYASATALAPGVVDLVLYEDSDLNGKIAQTPVVVAMPDEARLYFAGPIIVDVPKYQGYVDSMVRIMAGGTAAFLVEYTHNGKRLHGNNVLVPHGNSDQILLETDQTYFGENNEWLVVTPQTEGTFIVDLEVGGEIIDTIVVEAVSKEEVTSVGVFGEKEDDGGKTYVWAVGYDAAGEPIYGVDFFWTADGLVDDSCEYSEQYNSDLALAIEEAIAISEEEGVDFYEVLEGIMPKKEDYEFTGCVGDLYVYTHSDEAPPVELEASYGEMSDHITIHPDPEESAYVSNTESHLGCAAQPGSGSGGRMAVWMLSLVLGGWAVRRRYLTQ